MIGARTVPPEWPRSWPARFAVVGESPGREERVVGRPFVGPSGRLLFGALRRLGVNREEVLVVNSFPGDLPEWVGAKEARETIPQFPDWADWIQVPVAPAKYCPGAAAAEALSGLRSALERARPPFALALGAVAAWALLAVRPTIAKMAGHWYEGRLVPGLPVLVSYHPAAVLRQRIWWRPFMATLGKAADGPEAATSRIDPASVLVVERPDQLREWAASAVAGGIVAIDIETTREMKVDCVGMASRVAGAVIIPILHPDTGEVLVSLDTLRELQRVLEDPRLPKLFQNGGYDVRVLAASLGIRVRGWTDDTRILHHVFRPDLRKDLATQSAIHLNRAGWKTSTGAPTKRDE